MIHNKICASCRSGSIKAQTTIDTDDQKLPRWLRNCDYVQNFVKNYTTFRQNHPPNSSTEISVNVGKNYVGRSVLFWATLPLPTSNLLTVSDAKTAYGDFSNSGVSYVKKDGTAVFKLYCPRVYSVIPFRKQKPHTFPRHVHWVISDSNKQKWIEPVMTTNIICGTSKDSVIDAIKHKQAFVVNALSQPYHDRLSIPGTHSIGHQRVSKLSSGRICGEVVKKMKEQVPQLDIRMRAQKIDYSNIPIILYCAHSQCSAATRLAEILMRVGFTNLYYYKGGLLDWYNAEILRDAYSNIKN